MWSFPLLVIWWHVKLTVRLMFVLPWWNLNKCQKQAAEADAETARAYKQIDKLKRKHEKEVSTLNQLLAQSCRHKGSTAAVYDDSNTAKCDAWEPDNTAVDQQRGDEFEQPLYTVEEVHISTLPEPSSWFSGYDRCNV